MHEGLGRYRGLCGFRVPRLPALVSRSAQARRTTPQVLLCLIALSSPPGRADAAPPGDVVVLPGIGRYRARVLPNPPGYICSAAAISDTGTVCGTASPGPPRRTLLRRPVVWSPAGVPRLLLDVGASSDGLGTGPHGPVVGAGGYGCRMSSAFATVGARTRALPLPWPWPGAATDANASGVIVGHYTEPGHEEQPCVWRSHRVGRRLPVLHLYGKANGISARGQIVGEAWTKDGAMHAVSWSRGMLTDLGAPKGGGARAVGVNSAGCIVGSTHWPDGSWRATTWLAGSAHYLSTPVDADSYANAIGWRGVVAGEVEQRNPPDGYACLWVSGKAVSVRVVRHGALVLKIDSAVDINSRGDVLCSAGYAGDLGRGAYLVLERIR